MEKSIINKVDRLFLLAQIINDSMIVGGDPDPETLDRFNSVAASLTNKEHAEVVDRFMKDILERDFNGGNWH